MAVFSTRLTELVPLDDNYGRVKIKGVLAVSGNMAAAITGMSKEYILLLAKSGKIDLYYATTLGRKMCFYRLDQIEKLEKALPGSKWMRDPQRQDEVRCRKFARKILLGISK